jgi:hypothetical protein
MATGTASQLQAQSQASFAAWPPNWRAHILTAPPLIAPARQFTYPMHIAGEEDALARGALQLLVHPSTGGTFLATCALGFSSSSMPTGLFACPTRDTLCAVAGGYAYLVDTTQPDRCTLLPMKPVVELRVVSNREDGHELLLFVGFHSILAWGANGFAWETKRLSWEGVRLEAVEGNFFNGFGWNLQTDREVPFRIDLRTGVHTGGGF